MAAVDQKMPDYKEVLDRKEIEIEKILEEKSRKESEFDILICGTDY